MAIWRGLLSFLLLALGRGYAIALLVTENCTQAAADSLSFGWAVLASNIVGFFLLRREYSIADILSVALLPMVAAVWYSWFAVSFAAAWLTSDVSFCQALTGLPFEADGREAMHVTIWISVALSFWLCLAYAILRARGIKER